MNDVIDIAKVSGVNQITIPKAVREILGISPNDKVVFKKEESKVIIEKL